MLIRPPRLALAALTAATLIASLTTVSIGQQPGPDGDSKKRNWSEEVAASVAKFDVYLDDETDDPVELVEAYQWANPARPKVVGSRLALLYVHEGRPVASCKVYPTGRRIVHTFISMTDEAIVARQGDTVVWAPDPSSPKFQTLPGHEPPHLSAARRRIQMKAIAREFTAETGKGEAERQKSVPELRLLPTPLYRYPPSDDEAKEGVIDGAVFCFVVEGGNPQIFMMLEAVRQQGETTWRYGFSRRAFAELKAFHGGRQVWHANYLRPGEMSSRGEFFKVALTAR